MKRITSSAILLTGSLIMTAVGAEAQAIEMTGNVSIVTDYVYRGISQTYDHPAVQGGLDLTLPAGLYGGVWGSSLNFGEPTAGDDRAHMEMDVYGGIAPTVAGFDLDAGALYYLYPGAGSSRGYDFWELYGGVSRGVGPFGLGASVAYSPDYFADSGEALWTGIDATTSLPGTPLSLDASFGHQSIEENSAWGTPDYNAWSAGVSTELLGTSFGATVTGTDIEDSECFGNTGLCDTRFVLGVSRSM